MLEFMHENIWLCRQPLSFFGLDISRAMTVVKLRDHSILVYAPIEPTEETIKELGSLGKLRYVVCPNQLMLSKSLKFINKFKDAILCYPPNLEEKIKALKNFEQESLQLKTTSFAPWYHDLIQIPIQGIPRLEEFVFFHKPSKTLITTNLFSFYSSKDPLRDCMYKKITGLDANKVGIPQGIKWMVKDPENFKSSLEKLASLRVESMITGSGEYLTKDLDQNFWGNVASL